MKQYRIREKNGFVWVDAKYWWRWETIHEHAFNTIEEAFLEIHNYCKHKYDNLSFKVLIIPHRHSVSKKKK